MKTPYCVVEEPFQKFCRNSNLSSKIFFSLNLVFFICKLMTEILENTTEQNRNSHDNKKKQNSTRLIFVMFYDSRPKTTTTITLKEESTGVR